MNFWPGKRVAVTGGAGFIGSHACELLLARGAQVTVIDQPAPHKAERLREIRDRLRVIETDLWALDDALRAIEGHDIVLHLAATVGGIRFNATHQGTMLRDNLLLGLNVLEAARRHRVDRVLLVSSACVYPRQCAIPTPESEGFRDLPEPTNLGYGWAKRTLELLGQTYAEEFGMRVAVARPYNTYGPRDHFDSPDAHVIASLIKRLADGENPLRVWGSGEQSRSFIYVTDVARGMLELIERHPQPDPVNLGTEEEVTIRQLVEMLVRLSDHPVDVVFDPSRPSGQPRRNCDTSKAKRVIGFDAQVRLEDGLARTLAWYAGRQPAGAR